MAKILMNGALIGCSGFALYKLKPDACPYAFSACCLGICHGVLGIIDGIKGSEEDTKAKQVSTTVMELIPLPLVNIDLYSHSSGSSQLALGHGLFIIPFCYECAFGSGGGGGGRASEEGEEDEERRGSTEPLMSNADALKHLTILGNVTSLVYLAVNENNNLFAGMAVTAFLTKYGAMFMEYMVQGTHCCCVLVGHSVFNYLTSLHEGG